MRSASRLPAVDPVLEQARDAWPDAVGAGNRRGVPAGPDDQGRDLGALHELRLGVRADDACAPTCGHAWPSASRACPAGSGSSWETSSRLPLRRPRGAPLLAPDPELSARADELVSDVSDPVLRERIREAIELSLRRGS